MNRFKENVTSPDFWLRVIYTLLFVLAWKIVELLLVVILVLQLGFRLFTGEPHARLAGFGNSLAQFAWQMGRYVTGAGEEKPWPFMEWPAADAQWQYKSEVDSPVNAPQSPVNTPAPVVEPEPPIVQPDPDLADDQDPATDERPTP